MINHKYKFIFIHIPKTAGETIYDILETPPKAYQWDFRYDKKILDKHETITESITLHQINNNYFKFAFVRNPWDRMVSLWAYCKKRNIKPVADTDFKECIVNLEGLFCKVPQRYYSNSQRKINLLYPQYHFISDWYGNNILDFIGRFENLQEDFNTICDKIGISQQQLPYKNKSKHKHYTEYYDDETKQIVAEKYAKDIEYFGYEFGK